jgi:hypothetical protein
MEPVAPSAAVRPYRDRYAGLVCFGVLEILLGLLALLGLMSVLLLVATNGTTSAATPGVSSRALLPGASVYLVAAVFFLWLGIGSILARRWARALMLIAAWFWLVAGLLGLASIAWIYPGIQSAMTRAAGSANGSPGTADSAAALGFVQGCVFVLLAVVYVLLPLAFLLFYRSPHVKATCEARDPIPRWTDRCPLPVLGLSLSEGFGALACLWLAAGYHMLALFGLIITGLPAFAIGLGFAILFAFTAQATYRLAPWAWWSAASLLGLGIASLIATAFHPINWPELYRQMGFDAGQFEQSGVLAILQDNRWLWVSSLSLVPCLIYLVWVRRFFFPPVSAPAQASGEVDRMPGSGARPVPERPPGQANR